MNTNFAGLAAKVKTARDEARETELQRERTLRNAMTKAAAARDAGQVLTVEQQQALNKPERPAVYPDGMTSLDGDDMALGARNFFKPNAGKRVKPVRQDYDSDSVDSFIVDDNDHPVKRSRQHSRSLSPPRNRLRTARL